MKIQRMTDLEIEMRKVARGEIAAPADAASPSVESAEALVRLLTLPLKVILSVTDTVATRLIKLG